MSWAMAEAFGELAAAAGLPIMRFYEGPAAARVKADGSPVTGADLAAEEIILKGLARLAPALAVVAEETFSGEGVPRGQASFILVDALDGTREFIERRGEFTVNIALIENGFPICGAVYAPVSKRLWLGCREGAQAMSLDPGEPIERARARRAIAARSALSEGLTCLVSRSHLDSQTRQYISGLPLASLVAAGSSIKFCLIAEGLADIYPRLSPTMEWDTAAGDAILRAAGGRIETFQGAPLAYGKRTDGFRNPPFVARGR